MTSLNNLKHIALKGQGYFCLVKLYVEEATGENYALKELKREHYLNEDYRHRLTREIRLLEELQGCTNIVRLVGHGNDKDNEKLWYLMPYAKYNLFDYIKMHNGTLSIEDRFAIAEQVIKAIKFAHEKDILHRDISPNNVLVFLNNDKPIIIKVSDFGLGKAKESLSYYTGSSASGYGQILYVSPEQRLKLTDSTRQSDIYSLGKLVYFIFTGKDPDNLKPFELSTLVTKATEDNPADRFVDINEFETHFIALKDLLLNQTLPIEHITLNDVLTSGEKVSPLQLHELLVKGNYTDHVYYDYISPVNDYFLKGNNLTDYYKIIGNESREFVKTYINRLAECYQTVRWPFSAMSTFGEVLQKIVQTINDDETKLLCLTQLWYLAYEADQWSVQKIVKEMFNETHISKTIETQLAEYIISAGVKVEITQFSNSTLPKFIKIAIIKANEEAGQRAIEKEKQSKELYGDSDW